jgi:hypothetical protein
MLVAGLSEPIIVVAVVILVLLATFLGSRSKPHRRDSASTTKKISPSNSNSTSSQ